MAELKFETMSFSEKKEGEEREEGDIVDVTFLKLFYFELQKEQLEKIGKYSIKDRNTIIFEGVKQEHAERKFSQILLAGFNNLRNRMSKKPAVYIHKYSGIPLIGSLFIGIADKNVTTIEIKPVTSCNTDCIFCSVDLSRRATDFVVEKDYIVQEFKKLVEFKQSDYIEVNINPHGEPTLYADLPNLVADLAKVPQVKEISMNTNATLLTKQLMDQLIEAGMTRFNVSLHSLDKDKSKMLFNSSYYFIDRIKESCRYLASKGKLLLAPVWVPGSNDADMGQLIEFAKEINAPIRLQNYQIHTLGKKVKGAKEKHWKKFFEDLKALEEKHGVKISGEFPGYILRKTKTLPMPFEVGDVVNAQIVCPGEFKSDVLASASGRVISISKSSKQSGSVKVKITRAKYNTFYGEIVS